MGCTAGQVAAALRAAAAVVAGHRDELVQLDRAIGDGDHGENLKRGFTAIVSKLDASTPDTPSAVLKLAATTLISTVGGAAGPLYGTAFLRAALDGVVARGKAEIGDKTMVDALEPAVRAAEALGDDDVSALLGAAAQAAATGAESTVPLVARKGRASYLGERSAGHLDPGARSTALLLRSLADSAAGRS
jgi:dihydroxyacetone kinase-like protein